MVRAARIASGTGGFRVNRHSFNQGELSIRVKASLGDTPSKLEILRVLRSARINLVDLAG